MTPTLTTREYIATHLLAGLMMSEPYDKEHLVGIAIETTDELLRQLEETRPKPFQDSSKIIKERGPENFTTDGGSCFR